MRFPVSNTGSKEEFEKYWYVAQGFGSQTAYGYHEGADINLKTGGDTDLNQELKSIAKGQVVYYHYHSHPTSGFGRHLVLRIDGAWGTRWVHYAHCTDRDFTNRVQDVNEGEVIARLGKSGTAYAHLHFSIYKVDPATFGIDKFARTQTELNAYWEDPIAFINHWMKPDTSGPINDDTVYDFGDPWGSITLGTAKKIMNEQKKNIGELETKILNAQKVLA